VHGPGEWKRLHGRTDREPSLSPKYAELGGPDPLSHWAGPRFRKQQSHNGLLYVPPGQSGQPCPVLVDHLLYGVTGKIRNAHDQKEVREPLLVLAPKRRVNLVGSEGKAVVRLESDVLFSRPKERTVELDVHPEQRTPIRIDQAIVRVSTTNPLIFDPVAPTAEHAAGERLEVLFSQGPHQDLCNARARTLNPPPVCFGLLEPSRQPHVGQRFIPDKQKALPEARADTDVFNRLPRTKTQERPCAPASRRFLLSHPETVQQTNVSLKLWS
jgi:hypothetical protein